MLKGAVYILLAALLFGSNPSVEAVMLNAGLPADFIAFGVIAVSCFLALAAGLFKRESFRLSGKQLTAMIMTGVIGRGLTEIFLVMAYTSVPSGIATMIHFFFPTIVCITTVVLFHERWTKYKAAAIIFSVCGLIGIAGGMTGGIKGAGLFGLVCAGVTSVTFAFYYIMTERSSIKDMPPMAMLFYMHLFASIASAALVTVNGNWVNNVSFSAYIILIASGIVCFLGFVFLNKGIPIIGADAAAFINMLEPVTSIVLSVVLFHNVLSSRTVLGCTLIVGALFISAAGQRLQTVRVS